MARPLRISWILVGIGLVLAALWAAPASAQVAAPGDVYYKVHVDQKFKYYAFVNDIVTWENADVEGTAPTFAAAHDSVQLDDVVSTSSSFGAVGGTFTADLDSQMDVLAGRGLFHILTNTIRVDVYIKGNTGTAYHVLVAGTGHLEASRLGGFPGSLQPVNGTSSASFMDSTVTVNYSGSDAYDGVQPRDYAGHTTTQITVGIDTYSYAGTYTFSAPTTMTQAVCVLGCMTAPATFHAQASGHVQLEVYPCTDPLKAGSGPNAPGDGAINAIPCATVPTDVPSAPTRAGALAVSASPNPFNPATVVAFSAPAVEAATVEVFDARGRWIARIFDGKGTGRLQSVPWHAEGLPSGLYFVRVQSGAQASVSKLTLLK